MAGNSSFGAGVHAMFPAGPMSGVAPPPSYRAASGISQELANFWPRMSSGDSAVLPALRVSLDRARDEIRNDPHAGAGVDRIVDMLVGSGWQLVATPDARALGIDPKVAREIGREIRSEWRLYGRDPRRMCDARRRLSMNGIFRQGARTMASAGEATAAMKFRDKGNPRYRTCVALIDPDRLSNPDGQAESRLLRGGVEFDADGAAAFYHVRNGHPADHWNSTEASTWTRIPRETEWGRPVFIHAFEGDREDQTRAITPFASLVSRLRMLGKHGDTELANAVANALIAATVESDLPSEEIAARLTGPVAGSDGTMRGAWLDKVVSYYTEHPASLGGVRIPVMLPGSKIAMNSQPRPTTSFAAFQTAFLRSIAARLGISYEQLAQDFSQTNYSSARAALNETYRTIKRLQAVFAEQFVQPIYMAWLEEALDRGHINRRGARDFWDAPEAWVSARWIGPGRGYIDPVKEAQASAMRMENMTSSLEMECAEQGIDYLDLLDELELEEEEIAARPHLERARVQAAAARVKSRAVQAEPAEQEEKVAA